LHETLSSEQLGSPSIIVIGNVMRALLALDTPAATQPWVA
jgi:siroheme synthase